MSAGARAHAGRPAASRTLGGAGLALVLLTSMGAFLPHSATGQPTARVSGTVTNYLGQPLPDITVRIWNSHDQIARSIETDQNGEYVLVVQLGDSPVRVHFSDPVGTWGSQWFRDADDRDEAEVLELEARGEYVASASLERAGTGFLRGTVTSEEGVPLTAIDVSIREEGSTSYVSGGEVRTDGQGRWETRVDARRGPFQILFEDQVGDLYESEWHSDSDYRDGSTLVELEPGEEVTVDASLQLRATIEGTVTDPDGQPVPGVRVWTDMNLVGRGLDTTNAQGRYLLRVDSRLSPFVVLFEPADPLDEEYWDDVGLRSEATAVEVSEGAAVTGIDAVLENSGAVRGTVTDEAGTPIAGAQVRLVDRMYSVAGLSRDTTGIDGVYEVYAGPRQGPVRLVFDAPGYHTEYHRDAPSYETAVPLLVRHGDLVEIDAVLERNEEEELAGLSITGTVRNDDGEPLGGIQVSSSVPSSLSPTGFAVATTAADGTYRLGSGAGDLSQAEGVVRLDFTDPSGAYAPGRRDVATEPDAAIEGIDVTLVPADEAEEPVVVAGRGGRGGPGGGSGGGPGGGGRAGTGTGSGDETAPTPTPGGGGGTGGTGEGTEEGDTPGAGGTPATGGGPEGALPPLGGTGKPAGKATGDVHMRTLDGARYAFQAAGEFVAARAASGTMEVQLRMEPHGSSGRISVNTAVAALVEEDRVTIQGRERAVLRVNGAPVTGGAFPVDLPDGGRVDIVERGWDLVWPDGSVLLVRRRGRHYDVYLDPAPPRRGALEGLLGDFDGDRSDDFVTPDGTTLDAPPEAQALYGPFRAAWQVTAESSLFDYESGEGPDSFADPDFPRTSATVQDLAESDRTRAEAICREAGVTDPGLLEECVVDVGHTGDPIFAESAIETQRLDEAMVARGPRLGPDPIASGLCTPVVEAEAAATFRGGVGRPGRTGALADVAGAEVWSAAGFRRAFDPVVAGDRVLALADDGMAAVDRASGEVLWETDGGQRRVGGEGILAAGGAVFVPWRDGVAAYDAESGAECWRLPVTVPSAPAYRAGRLFLSVDEGNSGYVAAVDGPTGRILWRTEALERAPPNWPSPSEPVLGDSTVFAADHRDLIALDPENGEERWRLELGDRVLQGAFADGVLYQPIREEVLALDPATGQTLWSWFDDGVAFIRPVLSEERLFIADPRHLHALDRGSGELLWTVETPERLERVETIVLAGERLLAVNLGGELLVLDPATGEELEPVVVPEGGSVNAVTPLVAPDGRIILMVDGQLRAIR